MIGEMSIQEIIIFCCITRDIKVCKLKLACFLIFCKRKSKVINYLKPYSKMIVILEPEIYFKVF